MTVRDKLYTPESATESPYTVDVKVSVMDESLSYIKTINNKLMDNYDMGNNTYDNVTFTDLSGIFYVRIEPYSSGSTGTFYVGLENTGPITPGSNKETAIDITNYSPIEFEREITSSRPERWFKFTADGRYDLTVRDKIYTPGSATESPYTVDVKVSVMDESLSYIKTINNKLMDNYDMGSNTYDNVTFTDLSGIFYVKIEAYSSGNTGSFFVNVEKKGPVTGGSNDADAIPLTIGAPRVKDELTSSRPSRWFKFTAPANGSVKLTVYDKIYNPTNLTEEKPTVDVIVSLLNEALDFEQMDGVDMGGNNQSPRILINLTPGGVYYVKIDPYSSGNTGFFYIGVNP